MIRAKKSLGQHFLRDKRVASRIVDLVAPKTDDIVVEIGPGTGALTAMLAEKSARVIAIEIDPRMVLELRRGIEATNLEMVEGDALTLDWPTLIDSAVGKTHRPLRVVGNLPYYVSTPIIQRLLQLRGRISDMTFMLQEEVVDRIVSEPGGKEYGYLTVLARYYCSARKAFRVAPAAFRPPPKVWSAVVRLDVRESTSVDIEDEEGFLRFVRSCFAQRRKTVLNNLKASLKDARSAEMIEAAMAGCGLGVNRRAETFSLDEFASLFQSLDLDNMAEVRNPAHIEDH